MVGYVSQVAEMEQGQVDQMVASAEDETVVNSHGQPVAAEPISLFGLSGTKLKIAAALLVAYLAWKKWFKRG